MGEVFDRLKAALADRYAIEREIGAGGMATVYLARDLRHDRKVAVKVLRPELAAMVGAERFLSEIRTTASLQHPHILPLHESGEADGLVFYIMPFVDGESLRDRLKRETQLPIDDALRITQDMLAALDYAHRHDVVHRDIKPENVLLHDGQAIVADFGIARAISTAGRDRMTQTGLSVGTPHYMSPEQAMGEALDARSDLYAVGCVLYELLAGQPPFTGVTSQAITIRVLTSNPEALTAQRRNVPAHVDHAVRVALEKIPADRFKSARDFANALADPDFRSSKGPSPGQGHTRVRTRARIGAGLALATVAIAASAWGSGLLSEEPSDLLYTPKTFKTEWIANARFAADGQRILYSGAQGSAPPVPQVFVVRPDYPNPQPLTPPGTHLLAVSSTGEMAVLTNAKYVAWMFFRGTLARMPIEGGAPREILSDVREADWSPDGAELAIIHEVEGRDRLEYPIGTPLYESAGYLSDLRVSPTGDAVALFEHPVRFDDRGAVIVVDKEGHRTEMAAGFSALEGLTWRGSDIVFGANVPGGFLSLHSVDAKKRVKTIAPGPARMIPKDADPRGHALVLREERRFSMFLRTPGSAEDQDVSWLNLSALPILSHDGKALVFTNEGVDGGPNYSVMLRKTDEVSAARLGEGNATALSPDGAWVLVHVRSSPPRLLLYPTGPGEPRTIEETRLELYNSAEFFPSGDTILICGNEPSHASRCYAKVLDSGGLAPVTPEGTQAGRLSPDGRSIVAYVTGSGFRVITVGDTTIQRIPGVSDSDAPAGWNADGRLRVVRGGGLPARVDLVDLKTGMSSPLATIEPRDHAGLSSITGLALADDPRILVYVVGRSESQLVAVEGLR